jgi:hypothetical protein
MGQKETAVTATGKNRIMIYGPKNDGTYIVEFRSFGNKTAVPNHPHTRRAFGAAARARCGLARGWPTAEAGQGLSRREEGGCLGWEGRGALPSCGKQSAALN